MGDINTLLADPEFKSLSPAGQKALAGRIDPELGTLSDAAFQTFISRVSGPTVIPGMERLGGAPPAPSLPPLPGGLQKWDLGNASLVDMAGNFLLSPVRGMINAPGEVLDWIKRGGHNPRGMGTGGFLTEEPISMAYGDAWAAAAPKTRAEAAEVAGAGANAAKTGAKMFVGGVKGGLQALPTAKTYGPSAAGSLIGGAIDGPHGARIGAMIGAAPAVIEGAYQGARNAMLPPPPLVKTVVPPPPLRWSAQEESGPSFRTAADIDATTREAAAAHRKSMGGLDWKEEFPSEGAQKLHLNKMWHALLKDMEVEGSPAGTKAPSANAASQAAYGKNWMDITPDQMFSLLKRVVDTRRVPGYTPPPMSKPPE